MRRPAPVKPFFLVVPTIRPTADQREAQLAFGLSFIERFFVKPSGGELEQIQFLLGHVSVQTTERAAMVSCPQVRLWKITPDKRARFGRSPQLVFKRRAGAFMHLVSPK